MDHIKLNAKPNKRNTSNVEQELKDTLCTESNKKVYPFRQFLRTSGSATLADIPATAIAGV